MHLWDSPERIALFWDKVIFSIHQYKQTHCLIWMAYASKDNYGHFYCPGFPSFNDSSVGLSHGVLTHRFAWAIAQGIPPEGLDVDHLCRRTLCVNYHHLQLSDRRANVASANEFNFPKHQISDDEII